MKWLKTDFEEDAQLAQLARSKNARLQRFCRAMRQMRRKKRKKINGDFHGLLMFLVCGWFVLSTGVTAVFSYEPPRNVIALKRDEDRRIANSPEPGQKYFPK